MILGILAIASSLLTEVVTWANREIESFPPLRGKGAFLVALVLSFVGATFKIVVLDGADLSWTNLAQTGSAIFTLAQVWFLFIAQKIGLEADHV